MICVQGSLFTSALPFSSTIMFQKRKSTFEPNLTYLFKRQKPKGHQYCRVMLQSRAANRQALLGSKDLRVLCWKKCLVLPSWEYWPGEHSSGSPAALVKLTEVNRSHSPLVLYTAHSSSSSHRSQLFPNKRRLDWLRCPVHWWQQLIPELKPNICRETGL